MSLMSSQARVLVFRPGVPPEDTTIDTSLEAMQQLVGGYLGGLQLGNGLFLYFDEDGRPRGLATCAYVDGLGDTVVGVCIATGLDDDGNVRSLSDEEVATVKRLVTPAAFVARERFQA